MRAPVRITLRGHERRGDSLLLIFAVDDGSGEFAASVLVDSQHRRPRFPHELTESGMSLGPVADAALLERALQTVAVLDAADTWRAMRRHPTRSRRHR